MWLFHLSTSSSESPARSHRSFLSLHILVHFLGADWIGSILKHKVDWLCMGEAADVSHCFMFIDDLPYYHAWTQTASDYVLAGGVMISCVLANVCLSIRISGVEPWTPGGPWAPGHGKMKGLSGGVCLGRDWFEVILIWLPCSLGEWFLDTLIMRDMSSTWQSY